MHRSIVKQVRELGFWEHLQEQPDAASLAMLTGARPFSGPSLPFCLPVIATRSIVLSIGAESSG
jgi:hypothetical protein